MNSVIMCFISFELDIRCQYVIALTLFVFGCLAVKDKDSVWHPDRIFSEKQISSSGQLLKNDHKWFGDPYVNTLVTLPKPSFVVFFLPRSHGAAKKSHFNFSSTPLLARTREGVMINTTAHSAIIIQTCPRRLLDDLNHGVLPSPHGDPLSH